jgi:hypothetical protein
MDSEFSQNLFNNINTIYLQPEIERRIQKGIIKAGFKFQVALIILSIDKETIIQFDNEVEATCQIKVKDGIGKNIGEPIYNNEIESISSVNLPSQYINSAYIFLYGINGGYSILFDFRYNKGIRKKQLKIALDFLITAESAFSENKDAVFIDTLFSSVEILIKIFLIRHPDKEIINKSSHKGIKVRINSFSVLNEFIKPITSLYNKLHILRSDARYGCEIFEIEKKTGLDMLKTVKDFKELVEKEFA